MKTPPPTLSRRSVAALLNDFEPNEEEVKRFAPDRLVHLAKRQGLIKTAATVEPVDKSDGIEAAALLKVRSKWMDITPEIAKKWLNNNVRNRVISMDVVKAYARDMANGVFIPTHQGIAFNHRDELIDGQHTLQAIILSGIKKLRRLVTFGLPAEIEGKHMTTMDAVDRGRTRSVADQLKIQHGLAGGSTIAAVCRSIAYICCDERTRRLSVNEVLEIWEAFKEPVSFVIEHKSKSHGLKMSGVLAGFAFAIAAHDGEETTEIADELRETYCALTCKEPELAQVKGAIALLRDFLLSPDAIVLTRGTDRALAELVMQALWLHMQGKTPVKLEHALDGADHYRGLQPKRVGDIAAMFTLPQQ
jgi:hypothetical protein